MSPCHVFVWAVVGLRYAWLRRAPLTKTERRAFLGVQEGVEMCSRNRAEGWRHAKISGHENEDCIEQLLIDDDVMASSFLSRIGKSGNHILSIKGGGCSESNVPSVLGGSTKSKSDMYVSLSNLEIARVSLKKSLGGQVYLVTIANFISVYEKHFEEIPSDVKRAIGLYWGSESDVSEIVKQYGGKHKAYEMRKHRLVAETLNKYNRNLAECLINWFRRNIGKIAELCFSRGAAKDASDWAQFVWYKNELGEMSIDDILPIDQIALRSQDASSRISFGSRTGGSTIQLPFGFVQWHSPSKQIPGCLQFHHNYESVRQLFQ